MGIYKETGIKREDKWYICFLQNIENEKDIIGFRSNGAMAYGIGKMKGKNFSVKNLTGDKLKRKVENRFNIKIITLGEQLIK